MLISKNPTGTSAKPCYFHENSTVGNTVELVYTRNTVSNQEDVDIVYAGCTEIYGIVTIAANYTGDFYLPNVTYIQGGFSIVHDERGGYSSRDELAFPAPLLTSIVVPDLNTTSYIDINNAPALAAISFPSLNNTGYLSINNMPALTTISFPNMTQVDSSLQVAGINDCSVDFPSLETSGIVIITGNNTR